MKKILFYSVFLLLICNKYLAFSQSQFISILPKPVKTEVLTGEFEINANTKIIFNSSELKGIGTYLSEMLYPEIEFNLKTEHSEEDLINSIQLKIDKSLNNLGDEGYILNSTNKYILIKAKQPAGIFYGIQTLRQLVATEKSVSTVPFVKITDYPRFSWRGYLSDPARYFRTKAEVKRCIDLLAYQKLNILHLHLTDDEGWRVEIKKYPELVRIGSKVHAENRNVNEKFYYTQEDIKELVEYSKSRFVTLVPEIEMPGHSLAATKSYPQLGCNSKIAYDLCVSNENTLKFYCDVLDEIISLFPSPYIHVGADEVRPGSWKSCDLCKNKIDELSKIPIPEDVMTTRVDVKNGSGYPFQEYIGLLQGWFVRQIDAYISSKNRRMVGWDEILEGGLKRNSKAIAMAWRDSSAVNAAVTQNKNVVVCIYPEYYLCCDSAGVFPTKSCYNYKTIPKSISTENSKLILGVEGAMWGVDVRTNDRAEERTYPGLCAVAEAGWTPLENKNYDDFQKRLNSFMDKMNLNSKKLITTVFSNGDSVEIKNRIKSGVNLIKIVYTLDGKEPNINSNEFTKNTKFAKPAIFKVNTVYDGEIISECTNIYFSLTYGKKYTLNEKLNNVFNGGGNFALTDGYCGPTSTKNYIGYEGGDDIQAIVDLESNKNISEISLGYLESSSSWVFGPLKVLFEISTDGKNYKKVGNIKYKKKYWPTETKAGMAKVKIKPAEARFIRVTATSRKHCPKNHIGKGKNCWLFIDEIIAY